MVFNAKEIEEIISKRNELAARLEVCGELSKFILSNAGLCILERNYLKAQAWYDMAKHLASELDCIKNEIKILSDRLKQTKGS